MIQILPVFGHKNKTMTNIKNLRHGSLQMNVMNMHVNFGKNQCNIKQEILDQKIKVEKQVLNFFPLQLKSG